MSDDTSPTALDKREQGRRNNEGGHSFEERAAELYRLLRYDVEHGRLFSGRQVDLFLTTRLGDITIRRAVECKSGPVKAEHIDEFLIKFRLVRREYPTAIGTIISLASFTDAVASHAAAEGIQLTLYRDLAAQLLDGHLYAQNLLRESSANEQYPVFMFVEPLIGYDVSGPSLRAFRLMDEWLKDGQWNQLTLLGDVGTGKSFLSKMIARRLAGDYLKNPLENPLPILIDLRNADREFSLEGLILTHFARTGLSQVSFEIFQHVLAQGNIVLILDGFDEMAARITPQVTIRNFHELSRSVKAQAKVLLTCRTHYFKSRTEEEEIILGRKEDYGSEMALDLYWELISRKGFRIAYLRPFDLMQVEAYVKRARPRDSKQALKKIRNTYNLMELSQRPMLLEMIVKSIDKLTTSEINASTLYKIFTGTWVHRDQWRDVLPPEAKLSFLMALARSLWHDDRTTIHYSSLSAYVRTELGHAILDPQQFVEVESEIRTASFLTRDEAGNYGFAHKSYAEFFFARDVASQFKTGNFDCLHTRRFSPEILSFLKDMINAHDVERELERIVCEPYRPLVSENALICLYGFRRHKRISEYPQKELKIPLPAGMKLTGAQLDHVTLEGAGLIEVDMSRANLSGAILTNADLTNANLVNANFEKGDLSWAILNGARMNGSNCVGANLEGARLIETDLSLVDLSDAYLLEIEHRDTDFSSVKFSGALLPDSISMMFVDETYDSFTRINLAGDSEGTVDENWAYIVSVYPKIIRAAKLVALHYRTDERDIASQLALELLRSKYQEKLKGYDDEYQIDYLYWMAERIVRNERGVKNVKSVSLDDKKAISDYRRFMPIVHPEVEEEILFEENKRALQEVIENELPDQMKRVLKSYYSESGDMRRIAEVENLSLNTVYRMLKRAQQILVEKLDKPTAS